MAHGQHRLRRDQSRVCGSGRCRTAALASNAWRRAICSVSVVALAFPRNAGESRAALHAGMLSRSDSLCSRSVWRKAQASEFQTSYLKRQISDLVKTANPLKIQLELCGPLVAQ